MPLYRVAMVAWEEEEGVVVKEGMEEVVLLVII